MIGERSYGIYLLAHARRRVERARGSGHRGLLVAAGDRAGRGLTLVLASASWTWVEDPIRTHGLRHAFRLPVSSSRGSRARCRHASSAAVGCLALVAVGCGDPGRESERSGFPTPPWRPPPVGMDLPPRPRTRRRRPASPPPARTRPRDEQHHEHTPSHRLPQRPGRRCHAPGDTSCTSVVHVGDSTSDGAGRPRLPARRTVGGSPAQYARVGVQDVATDIMGARSIVETYHDEPNAEAAVADRVDDGYDGCWVVAMGTNDTANQFVGGVYRRLSERIDRIMRHLGDQPVMWLTLRTLLGDGPLVGGQNMQEWNAALRRRLRPLPEPPGLRLGRRGAGTPGTSPTASTSRRPATASGPGVRPWRWPPRSRPAAARRPAAWSLPEAFAMSFPHIWRIGGQAERDRGWPHSCLGEGIPP